VVWGKFRTYLKRRFRRRVKYIAILEFTKAGVPHLHILIDRFIPWGWIRETWSALGGGTWVNIKRVYDRHRLTKYLAKYLTKQVILSAPSGVRRWTASRGINLMTSKKSVGRWLFHQRTFDLLYLFGYHDIISVRSDNNGEIQSFLTSCNLCEG
jgi:hypothetical protein